MKCTSVVGRTPKIAVDTERGRRRLQQAAFDEGDALPVADDEVVEHPHLDHGERVHELIGEDPVRVARLRQPGRVVMFSST